ncbi:MAG: acetyl-CoA carboxylase, biotin carboxyl carrier protein [Spirochaetes bacterium GWF1_31_7]|nr:MAG: acetyl-CoA carboxylase, biotin carboxyl carrier protein [Spirochaetes bacterium GWE1_32_154]OHD46239.1 MAG: acetyl-CoA carboxylase, biotin carboxyl carrier protein [Spirochaetes bacterium GWE2_31_10]OHD48609.1 MAG: acetyl-CoA carboxylase, biotin carboxyl carrier protein [Spirochaetes bacterium GWF1_31_7]OHD81661.1 MAG: acetyl-CoA carboxylase, biotin carboxyl carrier protein [Spirochaetes bacterium RIFOXYB1_FULL_32_8]HBD93056.1 acetyl-CoA carboxylase biotin carboxyl carrier protein [Spir
MKDINITELLESMKKNDISEVIIKEGNKAYEFRRGGFKNPAPVATSAVAAPVAGLAPVISSSPVSASAPAASTDASPVAANNYYEVKSPLVGSFYSSPKPGSPAFVEVGQKVTKGQKLCLVEAMKNFNEIDSEVDGVIKEILCKDGDLVEFGKVIFKIEQK